MSSTSSRAASTTIGAQAPLPLRHALDPCTGVELSMRDGAVVRRALIVGDNNSAANIRKAHAQGAVSAERLRELEALYTWEGTWSSTTPVAAHPRHAADFAENRSPSVVCVHTGALKDGERHLFTLAEAGHRYTIVAEQARPTPLERGLAHKALVWAFSPDNADWIDAMLDAATP